MIQNHIARSVGSDVQRRIDALKIGQRMQDLPEELWHPSFRFYVKEDTTRKGGPNLRIIRLDPDQPSLTVTGFIFNKFVHPFENRFITVREAARLQGFPDGVHFKGTLTSTQMQVGNSVPVQLAKAVFESVFKVFKKNDPKGLSLFSGAGGMDIGAQQAKVGKTNFEVKVATDLWSDACKTLRNYAENKTNVLEQDIRAITDPIQFWQSSSNETDTPDIIFGGPPCQAFSQAGKQKGVTDERGILIFEFIRFIESLRPKYFVMENVANLKGIEKGHLLHEILHRFYQLGYNVTHRVLLAAHYGVPQMRRRIILIGNQEGMEPATMPEPQYDNESAGLYTYKPFVTVREAFEGLPEAMYSRDEKIETETLFGECEEE